LPLVMRTLRIAAFHRSLFVQVIIVASRARDPVPPAD
jgi:hypothetical protein